MPPRPISLMIRKSPSRSSRTPPHRHATAGAAFLVDLQLLDGGYRWKEIPNLIGEVGMCGDVMFDGRLFAAPVSPR